MSANVLDFPGMTRYIRKENTLPFTGFTNVSLIQRKIVLLATGIITEENLFNNGLFQNIYILYRMFESMGWLPLMIVNKKPESIEKIPWYMRNIRLIGIDETTQSPIPVKLYIEIGMSLDGGMRKFLKMCGAKICKLYLGNIINIDIETPVFYPHMNFAHHVIGELDDIWVSPHYYQHAQYARALNHVDLDKKAGIVAPYVWDSQILMNGGERNFYWRSPATEAEDVFLIVEPNISFQKSSLVPLMIVEAWYRKNPTWKGRIVVINGERINLIPFFRETIWAGLDIVKAGLVELRGRMDILSIMKEFPSAIPVCHQWNNEYNYMVLEYFATGYPVLHNATDWKPYGYFYNNSDIGEAVALIDIIRASHKDNTEIYRAHARTLMWRHSPYNPEVQKAWDQLIGI